MNVEQFNEAIVDLEAILAAEEEGIDDFIKIPVDHQEDDFSIRQTLEDYGLSLSTGDLF